MSINPSCPFIKKTNNKKGATMKQKKKNSASFFKICFLPPKKNLQQHKRNTEKLKVQKYPNNSKILLFTSIHWFCTTTHLSMELAENKKLKQKYRYNIICKR